MAKNSSAMPQFLCRRSGSRCGWDRAVGGRQACGRGVHQMGGGVYAGAAFVHGTPHALLYVVLLLLVLHAAFVGP